MEGIISLTPEINSASYFSHAMGHFSQISPSERSSGGVEFRASFFAQESIDPWALRIENFNKFIASRKSYLDNLKYLGEGWISGKSYPPNDNVLSIGKSVLDYLESWYQSEMVLSQAYHIPNIIMSPIPTGGFAFEIIPKSGVKIYFNIYNNGEIEIELDNHGFFSDVNTSMDNYQEKLAELLSQHGIRYNYSGRGDLIQIC